MCNFKLIRQCEHLRMIPFVALDSSDIDIFYIENSKVIRYQGVQRRMNLVVIFFVFLKVSFFALMLP